MKRVKPQALQPGMVLAQDVFVKDEGDSAVLRTGNQLSERAIARLRGWNVEYVFVEGEEELSPAAQMLRQAHSAVQPPPPVITTELRQEAVNTLQRFFEGVSAVEGTQEVSAGMVENLNAVVDQLTDSLSLAKDSLVNINDLKQYDDYTYHHSLSVAVLSIGLAQQMGLPEGHIRPLGLCAIMHDIGKTAVPVEIIRKPSRLSDQEFSIIKTHSAAGQKYLVNTDIGDEDIWRGVLHHHEKFDGTGYPDGLRGVDIPLWSRIISVADVYDAMTSNRPYRTPMQSSEAIEFIMGGAGVHFDFDIVSALVRKVSPYPVGSVVELSTGAYALVLDCENQMRPIVELLGSGKVADLYRDRSMLSVVVKRLVPRDELALA